MKVSYLKEFMKNYKLKIDTLNESQLQKIYNYPINPRDSRIYSNRGFVNIDNESQGGAYWLCFIVKVIKSFYYDSLGVQPDRFFIKSIT